MATKISNAFPLGPGALLLALLLAPLALADSHFVASVPKPPHIIFVMADDMGWGQTGFRGHPLLKTPNLDAMAANGLRFDRFYAGGPVCSPTRAAMLTGRSPERTGVLTHGYALRIQESTIAHALKGAGYVTGHFGKWHLNGHKGPGVPILADDPHGPGRFGFDEWVSVSNFFDLDPLMSRTGKFEQLKGDSSEIAVNEAVKFLDKHKGAAKPMFAVIWYGTPHSPFKALPADKARFAGLDDASANHHGELVAMDRSLGTLRARLRDLGIAQNTLLVFCSDNGGLPGIAPTTVGGLRGYKGSLYEGGIRVPGIIEWPAIIQPRVTSHLACVMDLLPTVADIVGLPDRTLRQPVDGLSLRPLFAGETKERPAPIGFRFATKRALVDNRYKLFTDDVSSGKFSLYDLLSTDSEMKDISTDNPEIFARMKQQLIAWDATMDTSFAGRDYPEGKVFPPDPKSVNWYDTPAYQPYLTEWKQRWEYRGYIERSLRAGQTGVAEKGVPNKNPPPAPTPNQRPTSQ